MTAAPKSAPLTIKVSRLIRAPRERVFEAWTHPDLRRKWWQHGQGLAACDINARPGGRYRMTQIGGSCEEFPVPSDFEWVMEGEFLEVTRPSRLVFTWNVNHNPPVVNNRVTIDLREVPGGTEVTITHEGIETPQLRDGTHEGWSSLLDSMAEVLATQQQ